MTDVIRRVGLIAIAAATVTGCSTNNDAELSRAREIANSARDESVALRLELGRANAELELLRGKSANEKVKDWERDLKLARSIAEGFLTALAKPNVDELHGFCTPEERKRATLITIPNGKVTWSIENDAMASSNREATFKGHIDSSAGRQPFVVLVILFNDSGRDRWLVDAVSIGN